MRVCDLVIKRVEHDATAPPPPQEDKKKYEAWRNAQKPAAFVRGHVDRYVPRAQGIGGVVLQYHVNEPSVWPPQQSSETNSDDQRIWRYLYWGSRTNP